MAQRALAIGAVFLVACGVRTPTPRPICVDPPSSASPIGVTANTIYDHGHFPTMVERIEDARGIDPRLAQHIIDALFPHHVNRVCPEITDARRAKSWVSLDEMQAKADEMGLLLPRILQRIDGHFTSPDVNETLFAIDFGHCVDNGSVDTRYVVFESRTLWDKKPVPRAMIDLREWHAQLLVGVVEQGGLDVLFARAPCIEKSGEIYTLRIAKDDEGRWGLRRTESEHVLIDPRCRVTYGQPSSPRSLYREACDD